MMPVVTRHIPARSLRSVAATIDLTLRPVKVKSIVEIIDDPSYRYVVRFKGLDLNLVVALDALLSERNVSRTADRLGLSQPATSAALGRLRHFFHDDLLVQHGKKMFPTPFADGLRPQLREFLQSADALIASSAIFDAATTHRTFRIVASDYIVVAVLSALIGRLAAEAPGITFDLVAPDQLADTELQAGRVDLLLMPAEFAPSDLATEPLFEERHVVVGWVGNPIFDGPLTEDRLLACGHVAVHFGAVRQSTFADTQLLRLGKKRRIEVVAGSFAAVPWLLVETERVAIMHERLARDLVERFGLRIAPLPFAFPLMREMMVWHPVRAADEGLVWLRSMIRRHVASNQIIHRVDRSLSGQSI